YAKSLTGLTVRRISTFLHESDAQLRASLIPADNNHLALNERINSLLLELYTLIRFVSSIVRLRRDVPLPHLNAQALDSCIKRPSEKVIPTPSATAQGRLRGGISPEI